MLVHHVRYVDGSEEHREFSKEDWEWAMRDARVAAHWGHTPERCFDPVAEVRGSTQTSITEVESFVSRAMLIEQKREQIRKLIEESRKPAQLTLVLE